MAVKTHIYGVSLAKFDGLLSGGDEEVASRLEARWFGDKVIADQEKAPDRGLIRGMLHEGELYDELDDETSLRLDKMIMVLIEDECGGKLQSFRPMRDDVQLVCRAVRESGKDTGLGDLLHWLANGRRLGEGDEPIDVPHYAYLRGDELTKLETRIGYFLESTKPKGFLSKLLGGKPALSESQQALLWDLRSTLQALLSDKLDLFSVNRDPDARWDMA